MSDKYKDYGWLLCDFDGDEGECETCWRACNPTYYRRTSFECDEGEYSCASCIEKEIKRFAQMENEFFEDARLLREESL